MVLETRLLFLRLVICADQYTLVLQLDSQSYNSHHWHCLATMAPGTPTIH